VAARNQELEEKITNPVKKFSGKPRVKICAQEKKPNYGANEALIQIDLLSNTNDNVFVVVNKFKSPGKYIPVFKTETKPQ
jgi:hypothetical protein